MTTSTSDETDRAYTQLVTEIVTEAKRGTIKEFIATVEKILANKESDFRQIFTTLSSTSDLPLTTTSSTARQTLASAEPESSLLEDVEPSVSITKRATAAPKRRTPAKVKVDEEQQEDNCTQKTTRGRPNWQAYWTSKEYGCRAYSPISDHLPIIEQTVAGGKANRFTVNQELRRWAESNGKFEDWKSWATERLKRDDKPLPSSAKDT